MRFTDGPGGVTIFETDGPLPDTVKPFEKVWLFTPQDVFDHGEATALAFLWGESRLLSGPPTFVEGVMATPFFYDGSKYVVDMGGCSHEGVREVRDHPTKPGKRQDRLVCRHCGEIMFDWGRALR